MPEANVIERAADAQRRHGRAGIASVAMALPAALVGNEPIAQRLGIEPSWIVERTGIESRRVAESQEEFFDLACLASGRALDRAGLDPKELDLIVVATMSHDRLIPGMAPMVARRIGAQTPAAYDVNAACTGFVAALGLGAAQIEAGWIRNALVVGVDRMAGFTDPDDRATAALFGDGAGAAVLVPSEGAGIGPVVGGSDGRYSELVRVERDERVLHMEGQNTFREAVLRMGQSTREALDAVGASLEEIDLFVFHQANARILDALGQRLGLDPDKVVRSIAEHGNTSAASVPIALAGAVDGGRLRPGGKVLVGAFGGGLTWAATVVEWEAGNA